MLDLTEIGSAFIILFAVIDVIGAIPLIISIKEKSGNINVTSATLVTATIMIVFLFVGESILKFIGVDLGSFSVAGSIIMAFIAFEMILGIELFKDGDADEATASIVPLAFPLLAGAGSLTTILSIRAEYATVNIIIAIVLNMIAVYIVLKSLKWFEKVLGPTGIRVMKKVFGIVLLAIAVKLFSANALLLFSNAG
mgnify:CR=1 FL=1